MYEVWAALTSGLEIDQWIKPRFGRDFLNQIEEAAIVLVTSVSNGNLNSNSTPTLF